MLKRQLKKRSDGRYELKTYVSLDENKKKKYKTVYGKLIAYLKTQPKKGIYVVTTKSGRMMTLNAWKSLWESYMLELRNL